MVRREPPTLLELIRLSSFQVSLPTLLIVLSMDLVLTDTPRVCTYVQELWASRQTFLRKSRRLSSRETLYPNPLDLPFVLKTRVDT